MATINFNANEVAPAVAPEPVPTGWYPVFIEESDMKEVEDKDGSYLELILNIFEGEYKGRKLFARLNLQNQNPVAVEIAQRQLSAICHSVCVMQLQDSTQLHNKPLMARAQYVKAVLNEDGSIKYDAKNEVKGYKAMDGAAAPAAAGGAASDDVPDWVNEGTQEQTPPSTPAPTPEPPAPPTPPPAAAAETVKKMTEKAAGATYEQFKEQNWTDEQMVEQGYMVLETVAPPTPPTPPTSPTPPAAPGAPASTATGSVPPWMQGK